MQFIDCIPTLALEFSWFSVCLHLDSRVEPVCLHLDSRVEPECLHLDSRVEPEWAGFTLRYSPVSGICHSNRFPLLLLLENRS